MSFYFTDIPISFLKNLDTSNSLCICMESYFYIFGSTNLPAIRSHNIGFMVVLRFFKNNVLLGAKEYLSDTRAEKIGKAWLKKARKLYPDDIYHFEMLSPVYLIRGKKTLDGRETYKRFTSIEKTLCSTNDTPKIELIFRKTRFDNSFYSGEWEGDLII